jgi:hypothetical protein
MSITVTETPHRGPVRTWTATNREDFCLKVLAANPRADLSPNASYDELVRWLGSDLRALDIQES